MNVWEWSPNCGRLVHVAILKPHAKVTQSLTFDFGTMAEEAQPPPKSLNQIFYPLGSTNLSSFRGPDLDEIVQFAFSPQYTNMLANFLGDHDSYLFLSEFEEVARWCNFECASRHCPIAFYSFCIKRFDKKWMHSHLRNSISF